jgi:Fe-S-cluster containining protein
MKDIFACTFCGHCCLTLADAVNGWVSDADLARWRRLDRADLLAWVRTMVLGPGNQLHAAWVDPSTGEDADRCPWLLERIDRQGYLCGIHDIKPDHCRCYPENRRHARATGCPGHLHASSSGPP